MSDPLLVDTGPQLTVEEAQRACPGDYIKHKTACFKFGDHSSYEMAKSACDSAGARLADIEPVFSKFIRDQVRTMGGNDFWVGSFINRGKVFRQKGRTSCPIMRGQMINDALYGLVDCNSANRYICQKYGETTSNDQLDFNRENPFYNGAFGLDTNAERPRRVNLVTKSTIPSTTTVAEEVDGSSSPVIYAVISVCVIILVLVALKFIISRYFGNDKRSEKEKKNAKVEDGKNNNSKDGRGQVFSPKRRKDMESKASSLDSAVPPSNTSLSLEKSGSKTNVTNAKTAGDIRMGRPAVNGPVPTRKPPHLDGDIALHGSYHFRSNKDKDRGRAHGEKRHRRTYSDPRSDYDFVERDQYHSRRRRSSYYSEKSWSSSDSDYEYSSRTGPAKVYQRYPSENPIYRDSKHQHYGNNLLRNYRISRRDSREHPGYYGRSHYGRSKTNRGIYNEDGRRHTSHRGDRYASYGRRVDSRDHRSSRLPSVSRKVQSLQEKQYFPQPHRLMSWVDPLELKDMSPPAEPLLQEGISHCMSREPIWVNRQIHMPEKSKQSNKRSKKSRPKRGDESHIYESLDEMKRNKELKKAARRNKQKKKEEDENRFKRNAHVRASTRSMASIQSRRLPTPPT